MPLPDERDGHAFATVAGVGGVVLTVGVLQAAMTPRVMATILAEEDDRGPVLANAVRVAVIVLSLFAVSLGNMWLPGGRESAAEAW